MINRNFVDWQAKLIALLFVIFSLWWVFLQFAYKSTDNSLDIFASNYCIFAIFGGFWGVLISKKWGGLKSVMGKAILFFSLGLFAQAFGQISYSYYVMIRHIEVPYPSIGDVGYFGSIPLYIYGIFLLSKASGISLSLNKFSNKIIAVFVPITILGLSYYIFLRNYQFDLSSPLVTFLDFAYPLGQSIYIAIALLTYYLSKSLLGGKLKNKIMIILFALLIQYLADFIFLYQASNGQWIAAGINDYMYMVGYFVMSLGLLQFGSVLAEIRSKK